MHLGLLFTPFIALRSLLCLHLVAICHFHMFLLKPNDVHSLTYLLYTFPCLKRSLLGAKKALHDF
uniref:Uncharacterized protein n=1 Tax=Anguilla anguilla TaxID=7936 RepID=A0A0E9WVT9_ANGAN